MPKSRYHLRHHSVIVPKLRNEFEFFFFYVTLIQRTCVCKKGTNCIEYNLLTTEQNSTGYNLTLTKNEQNIVRISAITCLFVFFDYFCFHYFQFQRHFFYNIYMFCIILGLWWFVFKLFECATCIYLTNSYHTCKFTL